MTKPTNPLGDFNASFETGRLLLRDVEVRLAKRSLWRGLIPYLTDLPIMRRISRSTRPVGAHIGAPSDRRAR